MWANESVFYQIYPLGFCAAPRLNDGVCTPRIRKVTDWIGHIQRLGANAVYFSPLFASDSPGYDTAILPSWTAGSCKRGFRSGLESAA
ncbi:MAG: hypothetical protein ACLSAP_06860 [Oscillospiraceae bacterium]